MHGLKLDGCEKGVNTPPGALMCPDTTRADVDLHTAVLREMVGALRG
jgi:hypothetical protein